MCGERKKGMRDRVCGRSRVRERVWWEKNEGDTGIREKKKRERCREDKEGVG
jgi:hypothetical protein